MKKQFKHGYDTATEAAEQMRDWGASPENVSLYLEKEELQGWLAKAQELAATSNPRLREVAEALMLATKPPGTPSWEARY